MEELKPLDIQWHIETVEDAVEWCQNHSVNIRCRPHSDYAKVAISQDTGHRSWLIGEGETFLEAVQAAVANKSKRENIQ